MGTLGYFTCNHTIREWMWMKWNGSHRPIRVDFFLVSIANLMTCNFRIYFVDFECLTDRIVSLCCNAHTFAVFSYRLLLNVHPSVVRKNKQKCERCILHVLHRLHWANWMLTTFLLLVDKCGTWDELPTLFRASIFNRRIYFCVTRCFPPFHICTMGFCR